MVRLGAKEYVSRTNLLISVDKSFAAVENLLPGKTHRLLSDSFPRAPLQLRRGERKRDLGLAGAMPEISSSSSLRISAFICSIFLHFITGSFSDLYQFFLFLNFFSFSEHMISNMSGNILSLSLSLSLISFFFRSILIDWIECYVGKSCVFTIRLADLVVYRSGFWWHFVYRLKNPDSAEYTEVLLWGIKNLDSCERIITLI